MAETGNAQLGLVALSQALAYQGPADYRIVPPELYGPIRQDAVLLRRAARNAAARDFVAFLKSQPAREIIEHSGYLSID
jgi:molybdate transport system substrate-binding protein